MCEGEVFKEGFESTMKFSYHREFVLHDQRVGFLIRVYMMTINRAVIRLGVESSGNK